ncbi:TPR end-of-group domain-containing protein [Thermopirellula anaerolimosa]
MMAASRESVIRGKTLREAEGYLMLGMPEHALKALDRVAPRKDDWLWRMYRGEALRDLGRFAEAVPFLEEVVRLRRDRPEAYLALGWCHKRLGRIDLACADLEAALAVQPDHALVIYNLACYYSLAGRVEPALDCLRRALELEPEFRLLIPDEGDFDPIRDDPRFAAIVNG